MAWPLPQEAFPLAAAARPQENTCGSRFVAAKSKVLLVNPPSKSKQKCLNLLFEDKNFLLAPFTLGQAPRKALSDRRKKDNAAADFSQRNKIEKL
jgi:hypothetical protein